MIYIYSTIFPLTQTTAKLYTTYTNLHLTQSFCSITSSFSQISDLTIIEPGIVLTSCSITSSLTTNAKLVNINNISSNITCSLNTTASLELFKVNCTMSSSFNTSCTINRYGVATYSTSSLYLSPGTSSFNVDFTTYALNVDYHGYLNVFPITSSQLYIAYSGEEAGGGEQRQYGPVLNVGATARSGSWRYCADTHLVFDMDVPHDITSASVFLYKVGPSGSLSAFGKTGSAPEYYSNIVDTHNYTGWVEYKLTPNCIHYMTSRLFTGLVLGVSERFTEVDPYPTTSYDSGQYFSLFLSSEATSSTYHPYLVLYYRDISYKIPMYCNIQTNFLTRTNIYPDLRPNPADPTEIITQPNANLDTTANIGLTGRIPKLVLVSDLSDIILYHSNVDGTWMDSNEERQVSVIDGTRRYTKNNDNSEFTINMHIFKEYSPTLKLLEILMIRKELVYFYPDRYALPIENILHQPAEFYISDIIPYYLMTDSDYDAVLIKLKSTRQTYFGDLPALGYGYAHATRYGVGF